MVHPATSLVCPACHATVAVESAQGPNLECADCRRDLVPVYSAGRRWLKRTVDLAAGLVLGRLLFGRPSTVAGFVFFLFFGFPTCIITARFASTESLNLALDFLFPPRGLRIRYSPVGGVLGLGPGN